MRSVGSVVLLVLVATVAGCAEEPPAEEPSVSLQEAEAAAEDLAVEATETTGVIRGVVVDQALRSVGGALVQLTGLGETTSNEEGAFGFDDLEPGTYFLTAAKDGYTTIQQSVDVVPGVDDPPVVKVLLTAIDSGTPFIEALNVRMYVSGSGWVTGVGGVTAGGFGVLEGNYQFTQEISPNGTVAQTEFVWAATTDLGKVARASGGTYTEDDEVEADNFYGPSPLVARTNATDGGETATEVYFSFWAWPEDPVPAGFHVNQDVDVFIHVFHNFMPRDGWTFTGEGAHPLPP